MLDIINRYAHGFVFVPVILACKKKGLFELLNQHGSMTSDQMVEKLGANDGHLLVALRMMLSIDWIIQSIDGKYSLTAKAKIHHKIPEDLLALYHLSLDSYLKEDQQGGLLGKWIEHSRQGWNISDHVFQDFLHGVLLVPILIALNKIHLLDALENGETLAFPQLSLPFREELQELFVCFEWAQWQNDQLLLTDVGRFVVDRSLIYGVTASYTPMLRDVSELLFGNPRRVFSRDAQGHETHLDRSLNVVGSGFQHEKYFAVIDETIISIFSRLPYEKQPNYIADMGCGDGTLLKRIYELIRSKSARGSRLDEYPVLMIGVDYNEKALKATDRTLADIPHLVLKGDIADPEQMIVDLKEIGIADPENILHIRSFLDHDRPYIVPKDLSWMQYRSSLPHTGVYVDSDGHAISPHEMVQSLVEHFERWAAVASGHGLVDVEVHRLEPAVVPWYLDKSESFHFDAYHAFSSQHLVEAEVFLMAAAEAGLFPKPGFSKRYPRTFPFARITLNWFEKRPYKIRHPHPADLTELIVLEKKCWPEHLRTSPEEIRRRIECYPNLQCVLEMDGHLAAAIFSQRIFDSNAMENSNVMQSPSLHSADGPVLQLLSISALPQEQDMGLGDQLLEFMLQWSSLKGGIESVVGVTHCKRFSRHSNISMEDYIRTRDKQGLLVDPILKFHEEHGAAIDKILLGSRANDHENEGKVILIEYNIHARLVVLDQFPKIADDIEKMAVMKKAA